MEAYLVSKERMIDLSNWGGGIIVINYFKEDM